MLRRQWPATLLYRRFVTDEATKTTNDAAMRECLDAFAREGIGRRPTGVVLARAATELDPKNTGLSTPERVIAALAALALFLVTAGLSSLARKNVNGVAWLIAAVPFWLIATILAIPVYGSAALFMKSERQFCAQSPLVITGYLELLERSRLVKTVRLVLRLRDAVRDAQAEYLADVLRGAGALADVTVAGSTIEAFFEVGPRRPLLFRQWFRTLHDRLLVPLDGVYGLARIEFDER
jgi:hypothetical protein